MWRLLIDLLAPIRYRSDTIAFRNWTRLGSEGRFVCALFGRLVLPAPTTGCCGLVGVQWPRPWCGRDRYGIRIGDGSGVAQGLPLAEPTVKAAELMRPCRRLLLLLLRF